MELRLGPGVAAGRAVAALGRRVQRGAHEVRARAQLLADLAAVRRHQVGARGHLDVALEVVPHSGLALEALRGEAAAALRLALQAPQHRRRLVRRADQTRQHL